MSYLRYNIIEGTNECIIGTFDFVSHNNGLLDKSIVDVIIPTRFYERIITVIGYDAFSHSNIERIFIPKTIKRILRGAFYNCQKLIDVSFEKRSALEEIGIEAFAYCGTLQLIDIPSTLKTFANYNYGIFGSSPKLSCISYHGSTDFSNAVLLNNNQNPEIRVSNSYSGTFGGKRITRNDNKCSNNHWNPFQKYIRPKPIRCTSVHTVHHPYSSIIYLVLISS